MNALKMFFVLAFVFVFSSISKAQISNEDYFVGKWDVTIKGTPQGDVTVPFEIIKKDGKYSAKLKNMESGNMEDVPTAEIKGTEASFAFSAGGYDLTMTLTKKDDDNATGKLMEMFDVEAVRKKE
jgi:phage terminase large subunit-like protein